MRDVLNNKEPTNTHENHPHKSLFAIFGFDPECPRTVSSNGVLLVENEYDFQHRRIHKTTSAAAHSYIYDGWNLIHEIVEPIGGGTASEIQYFWGTDLSGTLQGAGGVGGLIAVSIDGQYYFPCYDNNGNITAYVSESGAAVTEYVYDAFGNTITRSGTMPDAFRYRFSTKYFDSETGLHYYGYRFYSSELGRWINRDPIEEDGGANLCAFVGNNGINLFDLLGKAAYVLIYDSHDVMFETWATAIRTRIENNGKTYFGDKFDRFNPQKDKIHMIPITGPSSFQQLKSIRDVVYLGSFGHGTGGRIWWSYELNDSTSRSVVTGIPGYRPAEPDLVDRLVMGSLVLNFDKCGFIVEFYHCNTARWFDTDKNGTLTFSDSTTTTPNTTGADEGKSSIISYYKSLLDENRTGYPYTYHIWGSSAGINNGYPGLRGYPRPVVGSNKKTEY
jgi:RHS repeat-associated core domain